MDEIIEENVAKQTAYLLGEQSGLEKGLEKGIEQGIEKNKKEIVFNMLKDKLSLEVISKYTNLTIPEVEKIINNNKE